MANKISIGKKLEGKVIKKELHSQFIEFLGSCISDGVWVGKDSEIPNYNGIRKAAVDALAKIEPPVMRWPGGCYADMYHWRDGIGPERKITWNEKFGTYEQEKNEFGTHEFMEFCERIGSKPWLNINMLRGSVEEMVEWAEYCNRRENTSLSMERAKNGHPQSFDVEYWGIGNEVWCGGGNYTAKSYADEYRKFASAMPGFKPNIPFVSSEGIDIKLIASGPDGNKPFERVKWTRELFESFAEYRMPAISALDLHFYNWNIKDMEKPETVFEEEDWYSVIHGCLELEEVIKEQYALIQEGLANIPKPEGDLPGNSPDCRLVIGEWGNWHGKAFLNRPALYQQCTMRDAITTAITLDIFHRNCDMVDMACAAQTVNVLNSLILTQGEHTILTPNYYVFDMYKPHRDAILLEINIACDQVGGKEKVAQIYSLASEKDNIITLNLINTDYSAPTEVQVAFDRDVAYLGGTVLRGESPDAYNCVENQDAVTEKEADAPKLEGKKATFLLPAASVQVYQFSCA